MEKKESKIQKFTREFHNFDVTLVDYTNDFIHRNDEIIATILEKSDILNGITPITSIKAGSSVDLNLLTNTVSWSNTPCSETSNGETYLTARNVAVSYIADRLTICAGDLAAKLPQFLKAGAYDENLNDGFINSVIQNRVDVNAIQMEKALFQGDKTSGTGNMAAVNGLLAIAGSETSDLASYGTFSTYTKAAAVAFIENNILANMSAVSHDVEDYIVFMSMSDFSLTRMAVLAAYPNLVSATGVYMNGAYSDQIDKNAFLFPGTNVIIKGTSALTGNGSIIALPYSEIKYAVDLEAELNSVNVFFDKMTKSYVFDIVFGIGFQYANPGNVIYMEKL